jgi:hypothetical protein
MSQLRNFVVLAGAAASIGAAQAQTAPATVDRDQVRAIVAEVLADAETRSSLLSAGATAGHDGRFFIASGDGNYRLNVGGMIQVRYIANFRDESNASDPDGVDGGNRADDFDPGFQNRRTKLRFDGNIVNPNWFYAVNLNFGHGFDNDSPTGSNNGFAFLEDAYAGYDFGNGWKGMIGQFKIPLLREELVSDARQLAAERSVTNSAFTQGWSQGVQAMYRDVDWDFAFAFSDGLQSQNTDWTNFSLTTTGAPSFIAAGEADFAFTGRFQYKFAGQWEDFDDFTAKPGQAFSSMLGVAGHYQQSPNSGFGGDVDRNTFEYTVDISLEGDGWNAFAAFVGRHDEFKSAGSDLDVDDFGVVVQGGYRWSDTEIFGRWDALIPDSNWNLQEDWYHFITVGLNQYYAGHAAKATLDVCFALNETNDIAGVAEPTAGAGAISVLPNTGIGLLGSNSSGEAVVRLQFQLLF